MQIKKMLRNFVRALRLSFITASVLPFIFGSLIRKQDFRPFGFLLGLVAVVATHLSANLINDYADSKSGVDWHDKKFYKFFGGSKLIQEKIYSERFYLQTALFFAALSFISVLILSLILNTLKVIGFYLLIIFLGWSYSKKPLRFSYRRLGEFIIFLLFGPALVMGGYFIQAGIFPDVESFILSLPFGFFTTAILFVNEIPDYPDDRKAGKLTWVDLLGQKRSYLIYALIIFLGFLTVALGIIFNFLGAFSFASFVFILPAVKAIRILREYPADKIKLIASSKLTIAIQAMVSIVLILDKII